MKTTDAVTDLACELIGIDSVNPALVPGAAGETEIAGRLAERLACAGFEVGLVPAPEDPRRVSVVAVREGGVEGPTVVLNGHLDTVGVEGMADPFTPRVDADRLFGRGASDMKGGVAGLVVAAEHLAHDDAPGRIVVALVADEEDASVDASAVIETLRGRGIRPDACLIAEPTWLDLAVEHRGFALYTVTLEGRAAHSSQPELAVDVMTPLAALLTEVAWHDAGLRESTAPGEHGSLMATVARAGSAPFTIAAQAVASVERRTVPGERADVGQGELDDLVARVTAQHPGVTASVIPVVTRAPWRVDAAGPAASLSGLLSQSLASGGHVAGVMSAPYWMESALWQEAGVPTVVCGPAGGGLHAVDEWVDLEQLRLFPIAVADAVGRFLRA